MPVMCNGCFELFKKKYRANQFCKDCGGRLVEIDELFAPMISLLNKKGYYTTYCCSGHFYDWYPTAYIAFRKDVVLPSLPVGYEYDEIVNPEQTKQWIENCGHYAIRPKYQGDNIWKLHFEVIKSAYDVLVWSLELPMAR